MKSALCLISVLLVLTVPVGGMAGVSVRLDLDKTQAHYGKGVSDSVKMILTVSGTKSCDDAPHIRGLAPFDVSGGGSSSRVKIVNGQYSATLQYTYFLQPTQTGTFTIGPARVKVDDTVYKSNTGTLQVIKAAPPKAETAPVFLTAELSTSHAVVEQQVRYTLKLHLRKRASDLSLTLPEADHLAFKQLGKPKEYRRSYKGRQYGVVEIRYALSASKQGTYDIAPATIDLTVYEPDRQRRRGFFNDPFFDEPFFKRGRPVQVRSDPLRLTVRELPKTGQPPDFSGMVGTLHMASSLDPTRIRVGESATLTVTLRGSGNVHRMPDPNLPDIGGIKIYADEPGLTVTPTETGLTGVKEMKWALVPESAGTYHIPALSVSLFDVTKHRYERLRSSPYTLEVLPRKTKTSPDAPPSSGNATDASGRPKGADAGRVKQEIQQLGQDILPIHTSLRNMKAAYGLNASIGLLLWGLLIIPFAAYGAVLAGLYLRRRSERSLPLVTAKKAGRNFLKAYTQSQNDPAAQMTALRDYMNDRFGLFLASITPDEAARILTEKGISPHNVRALETAIQRIENAVYGGQGTNGIPAQDPVPGLIKQIEKELP